jgi:hypothetical protein
VFFNTKQQRNTGLARMPVASGSTPGGPAEEEEEEFITSGNWRGKHNLLSRVAGADQP